MTEKLYYQDAYIKEFDAQIEECLPESDGQYRIRLDRTAFYPEGGGQGADTGVLILENGSQIAVTDTQESGKEIWHTIKSSQIPEPKMTVHGLIDWEKRFDHMQQHSGEHIVSGMICAAFSCDNVGFHMGEDTITIDYNARISMEDLEIIENKANKYIWEDHPCMISWPTEQELKSIDYRSKKELTEDVRIVSFPGADTCACCGTHVATSAQVGLVKLISAKNFHEGTRIEMYCGKRAFDYLSVNFRANKETAVLLSSKEADTSKRVQLMIDENIRLKQECTETAEHLLGIYADRFQAADNVFIIDNVISAEQGRILADMISDRANGIAAVFTKAENGYRYALIRHGQDISEITKKVNAGLSGRGGGRNGFAQGSVGAPESDIRAFFNNEGFTSC